MSRYHELSVADKLRYHRERNREPDIRCPRCGIAVQPVDLMPHIQERCGGQREPHHRSKWLAWKEALALGVEKHTLSRWVAAGLVRTRGAKGSRQYLLRDVAQNLAVRLAKSCKYATGGNEL